MFPTCHNTCQMSHDMTKPTNWPCAQRRLTSGIPGWSESSLGAHSFCWFCHVVAKIKYYKYDRYFKKQLSHVMRKPVMPYANNKGATCQIRNYKTLACFCSWAGRFEAYLVNPEDRFSRDEAQLFQFPLESIIFAVSAMSAYVKLNDSIFFAAAVKI